MTVNELKRVKALEAENARLKRMYAELNLMNDAMKGLIEKKWGGCSAPAVRLGADPRLRTFRSSGRKMYQIPPNQRWVTNQSHWTQKKPFFFQPIDLILTCTEIWGR
jgi:hypothetical protein